MCTSHFAQVGRLIEFHPSQMKDVHLEYDPDRPGQQGQVALQMLVGGSIRDMVSKCLACL